MTDKARFFFHSGEEGYKDLQVTGREGLKTIDFSITDEWCGSTETGFGATVDIDINKEQAKELINVLQDWIDKG